MSIIYPKQLIGVFGLEMSLSYSLIHKKYGFDFGKRYHLDIVYRTKTGMEIDKAVFNDFGKIGLGSQSPIPRGCIAPYGHRFIPVMFGCQCQYFKDAEPSVQNNYYDADKILALAHWNNDRFEKSEAVYTILSQLKQLKEIYAVYPVKYDGLPHSRMMSCQQNLGSVINNAFSVQGEQLFIDYLNAPDLVHRFYKNITELMLLAMSYFQVVDGWPLAEVFIGNCSVSMISPNQYADLSYPYDRQIMGYAKYIGAKFMVHQDSDVNAHLANYANFNYLHYLDVGQDTNFEQVAKLFPEIQVNCILFPAWLQSNSIDNIREELTRLMIIGKLFKSFSFSVSEIDQELSAGKIFDFYEIFQDCALNIKT